MIAQEPAPEPESSAAKAADAMPDASDRAPEKVATSGTDAVVKRGGSRSRDRDQEAQRLVKEAESLWLTAIEQNNPSVLDNLGKYSHSDEEEIGAAWASVLLNFEVELRHQNRLNHWFGKTNMQVKAIRPFLELKLGDEGPEGFEGACAKDEEANKYDGAKQENTGKLDGTPARRRRASGIVPNFLMNSRSPNVRASVNPNVQQHQEKGVQKGRGRPASAKTDLKALRKKLDAMDVLELCKEAKQLGMTTEQRAELIEVSEQQRKALTIDFIVSKHASNLSRAPSSKAFSQDGGESVADSVGSFSELQEEDIEPPHPKKQEMTGRLKRRAISPQGAAAQAPKAKAAKTKATAPLPRPPLLDQEDDDGDGRLSVRSHGSKASKASARGRGRGRGQKAAEGQGKKQKKQEPPKKPPPPSTPPPVATAAPAAAAAPTTAAAAAPSIAASSASGDLPNPDFLLTQHAKDRLQHKIDMLNDNQLERVLDFLEADLANDPSANPDEEIQLDLDRLALPKMVALVRLIEGILDEAKTEATAQPAAAATSTQPPPPPGTLPPSAAQPAAAATSAQQSPQEAAQSNMVLPEGTSNSPRVPGPATSPSVVEAWTEYNARLDTHESRKQAARSSIEPVPVAAAPAASASQAPPPGSDSMLHDAAAILGMMD